MQCGGINNCHDPITVMITSNLVKHFEGFESWFPLVRIRYGTQGWCSLLSVRKTTRNPPAGALVFCAWQTEQQDPSVVQVESARRAEPQGERVLRRPYSRLVENVAAAEDDLALAAKPFPADGAQGHLVVPPGQSLCLHDAGPDGMGETGKGDCGTRW